MKKLEINFNFYKKRCTSRELYYVFKHLIYIRDIILSWKKQILATFKQLLVTICEYHARGGFNSYV